MITVYSKPECPQCDFTKKLLDNELKLPYQEVDVTQRPGAADALRDMGFRGVPVVAATGIAPWQGFSPDRLRALRVS